MTDDELLRRAIALSARAAATPGCEPFGAVVARDGGIVGEGFNRSAARLDPTSHGETEAIRDACARLGTLDLRGCELFSSCEPCALCVAAAAVAGIGRVVYAASLADSDAALGRDPGVVVALRAAAAAPGGRMTARPELRAEAVAVLEGVGRGELPPPLVGGSNALRSTSGGGSSGEASNVAPPPR